MSMFIKQKIPVQEDYITYTRDNPRRSERARTPVDRYQVEVPPQRQRSRSRSRHRSPGHARRSSSAFQRLPPLPQEAQFSDTGNFEQNLVHRSFATGCFRPPTPLECKLLSDFIVSIKEQELEVMEEINRQIKFPRTNAVFDKVIQKLKNGKNEANVKKEHYSALMNSKEMADISVFAVYFWNALVEITQRIYDVIIAAQKKISPHAYKNIFTSFKKISDDLKIDYQLAVDSLKFNENSRMYYEKYKASEAIN